MNYKKIILLGFILVLLGVLGPLLMVLHVVESTFLFNFLSFGASVVGLVLGIVGAAWYAIAHRRKPEE
jgi:uncharacterized membrane protein